MSTIGYYICVPFAWLVRLFYDLTNSYGVALILFTLVIKLIMLPFQMKSKKSMMRMSRVSGQMQDLQKRYAKNQAKLQEEMQKLYEEEGVNPMSGCLWSFLPFPILIALYSIIRQPITHFMMLPESAVETLIQTATNAGVNMANIVQLDKAGAAIVKNGITQLSAYGQINLVKAVQEMGLSTPDGWFNVNYKFLGLDLTATPWEYVKSFTFTWAVIGVILIPILAGCVQQAHHEDPASGGRCRRRIHEVHDVYDAPDERLHRLHHACRIGRVLDRPECVLPDPGGNS